jgi:hypothetical protein
MNVTIVGRNVMESFAQNPAKKHTKKTNKKQP